MARVLLPVSAGFAGGDSAVPAVGLPRSFGVLSRRWAVSAAPSPARVLPGAPVVDGLFCGSSPDAGPPRLPSAAPPSGPLAGPAAAAAPTAAVPPAASPAAP
ncbi:hypothetical protein ACFVFS_32995, partial [Kitasatospora sp. NPDC057692]